MSERVRPEDCPEPFWHETHRYCPACSWTEPESHEPGPATGLRDVVEWLETNWRNGHAVLLAHLKEDAEREGELAEAKEAARHFEDICGSQRDELRDADAGVDALRIRLRAMETDRDRWQKSAMRAHAEYQCSHRTLAEWNALETELAELREAVVQIADGDVPWADGMVRAGTKDAHDLQAFARQLIEEK